MELLGFFLSPRSPLLGDGDEVDDHQDGHDESRLEAKTAQDGEADQGSLRAPETQVLGRLRLAHESDHRGGDDEIGEQELPVAQVGVDLDKGKDRRNGEMQWPALHFFCTWLFLSPFRSFSFKPQFPYSSAGILFYLGRALSLYVVPVPDAIPWVNPTPGAEVSRPHCLRPSPWTLKRVCELKGQEGKWPSYRVQQEHGNKLREAVEGHVFEEAEGGDQGASSFPKDERERPVTLLGEQGLGSRGEGAQGRKNALLRNFVPGKKEHFLCARVCLKHSVFQ